MFFSTPNNPVVKFADSASNDAFSRIRTSHPVTLFDSMQQYGDNALVWENSFTGTGAVSNLLNESSVILSTGGTGSGAKVTRSTRAYHRYQPGKSQMILMTFTLGTAVSNLRRRVGYFDANNGLFLEQISSGVSFVRRTNVTGTPTDTAVAQASWNIDKFDGTGPSGITLDFTKTQIMVIDLQWLGAGRVRFGFDINGIIYLAHQSLHANILSTVYMTTACLPIRLEIENTGVTSGTNTMQHICSAVISEGGFQGNYGFQFSEANTVGVGVTIRRPILSIRAKTTGPNSVRNTGHILLKAVEVMATSNSCLFEVVLNGTLTGASFAAVNATYSLAERDSSATAISGGIHLLVTLLEGFKWLK